MRALRSYIALLLLLCLTRTLAPEAWILALHAHEHTDDKAATAVVAAPRLKGKPVLGTKHQHCEVEDFYNVPLLLALPVVAPQPVVRACFATAPVPTVATAPWIARQPAQLRGPPAA